ncbi:hypothetical protein JL722_7490 [Aureococcus anophagefferens]|nr:hypothetical protein JL722_7490 [Aureococcus anophagefferens]
MAAARRLRRRHGRRRVGLSSLQGGAAGPGKTWDGAPAVWAPGTAGTVDSIRRAATGAGERATPYDDVTLQKVGYQTDNGAFYCFCGGGDCSQTLIDKGAELRDHGAPMGYLSFQGAGASSGRGQAAPWCVSTWGVDGGLRSQYPLSVGELSRAFDAPVQLYAPYFCPGSDYFNETSPWTALGMASFEPDFMQANYNCVDEFVQTVDGRAWQRGMADAALARNRAAPSPDGAPAASCVTFTTAAAAPVVTLPASDFSNATAGTDYAPSVTWLAPVCESGTRAGRSGKDRCR